MADFMSDDIGRALIMGNQSGSSESQTTVLHPAELADQHDCSAIQSRHHGSPGKTRAKRVHRTRPSGTPW